MHKAVDQYFSAHSTQLITSYSFARSSNHWTSDRIQFRLARKEDAHTKGGSVLTVVLLAVTLCWSARLQPRKTKQMHQIEKVRGADPVVFQELLPRSDVPPCPGVCIMQQA